MQLLGLFQSTGMETMSGSYNPLLVIASYLIASCAAYVALTVVKRVLGSNRHRRIWLGMGALAMGCGIWTMHFVGMLAFQLPIPMGYDLALTALSLLIAVGVSLFALSEVARPALSQLRLIAGGLFMGSGIAAMHYTGMAAMRMQPAIVYDPLLFALSIVVAVAASTAALWICFKVARSRERSQTLLMVAAAAIMGLAIIGMHYTGMMAANFPADAVCLAAGSLDSDTLGETLSLGALLLLGATILVAILDGRHHSDTERLNRSLEQANSELDRLATTDQLTGLANRTGLERHARQALSEAEREGSQCFILFVDLNGFKMVNNEYGHSGGDALLAKVAPRLKQALLPGDLVARFGGDEFIIVAKRPGGRDAGSRVAQRVCDALAAPLDLAGQSLSISCTIGIAMFPTDGSTLEELVHSADSAMFEVRNQGRSNYGHFTLAMGQKAKHELKTSSELRRALAEDQLELYYQPKIDTMTGRICGAEALVRWRHPEEGLLSPGAFIGVAEKFGLINALGDWVLREACGVLGEWSDRGKPFADLGLSINASPHQFRDAAFMSDLPQLVTDRGFDAERLTIEITETAAMERTRETLAVMQRLAQLGVRLSIDDFGTGYSSLSYLRRMPVAEIKVDKSFVTNLIAGSDEEKIVWAILDLATRLDLDVVVEGIETETTARHLIALGVPCLQGHFFSHPIPRRKFEARVVEEAEKTEILAPLRALGLPS